ncbi:MAG: glycoside hydrolase family 3 C-terminal domain-containing protein [Erysipelotrichaceae bacterium]|nr:glycoside hydrolase family 3 C-terminal domain-containing protein [Erysipelotrichaceae bacterium]
MKTKSKKLAKTLFLWAPLSIVTLTLGIVASAVTSYYDQVIRDFMGVLGAERVKEVDDGLDKIYNKKKFDTVEELNDYEKELVREIGQEGYVLLKNDTTGNKGLPLKTQSENRTKVSLFSHSSVDLLAGGTGSGTGALDTNLKEAFEAQGFEVNNTLWNYYTSGPGKTHIRGTGSVNYGHGEEDWRINECSLTKMRQTPGLLESATGTTPIFVISRTGGEGRDLARNMARYTNVEEDKNKHYLQPDSYEHEILKYLNDNFDNVILVVNTNNVFELGWINLYPNIKSVLWVPGGGGETANSLVDVISGKVNPSGHLVDTIAYDFFLSPAMQNFGDIQYTYNGSPALYSGSTLKDISNTGASNNGLYGVSYDEGIYVGYKYYETRYFDYMNGVANVGDYIYDDVVQFPFGYGLSYSSFTWSDLNVSSIDENGNFTASVKVKNTGDVAGKDVVEFYVNVPYTNYDKNYHLEKSAISLVGFEKTKLLQPGEEEIVSTTLSIEEFKTYDDVNAKTYIIEKGNYYITAASDAHEATNNILNKTGVTSVGNADFVASIDKYNSLSDDYVVFNKSKSGEIITNHFDDANYIERNKYLSRQDWENTFPITHGSQEAKVTSMYSEKNGYTYYEEISLESLNKLKACGTAQAANNPISDNDIPAQTGFGIKTSLELIDARGKNYDDFDFDTLVSAMSKKEVGTILNLSGYTTGESQAIAKPAPSDLDGPMGLNLMATHEPFSIAYPAEVTIAATWNKELSAKHGEAISQDGLRDNVLASGWYGPGANIHRTPFSGRNFEYYSEDSFMSGVMAKEAIVAAAKNGMYSFIKHFALNDQEDHRDQNGICSWANEQTIREIYLKPFQMVFEGPTVETKYYENGELKIANTPCALAVMTSFNRIGYTWAGGDYRLLTEVLRKEWNFNGLILTDYSAGATSYMHTEQMLRAGGDAQLSQYGNPFDNFTNANIFYAKEAMKHVCYTVANSNAMNGFTHGARLGYKGLPVYYFIIIAIYLASASCIGVGTIKTIKIIKNKEE